MPMYNLTDPDNIVRYIREQAKERFEEESREILAELPTRYRRSFGNIVFHKTRPALIVSPFDVPPGALRTEWMKEFEKHREQSNLNELPHLVYMYGRESRRNAYSFVPWGELVTYEQGVERGYDQIPPKLQRKILEESLSSVDEKLLRGLTKMEEDARKGKRDRRGAYGGRFLEVYDLICRKVQPIEMDVDLANGARVSVYNRKEKKFNPGTIIEHRQDFYHIAYDDAYKEWLPLIDHNFLVLDSTDTNSPSQAPSRVNQVVEPSCLKPPPAGASSERPLEVDDGQPRKRLKRANEIASQSRTAFVRAALPGGYPFTHELILQPNATLPN